MIGPEDNRWQHQPPRHGDPQPGDPDHPIHPRVPVACDANADYQLAPPAPTTAVNGDGQDSGLLELAATLLRDARPSRELATDREVEWVDDRRRWLHQWEERTRERAATRDKLLAAVHQCTLARAGAQRRVDRLVQARARLIADAKAAGVTDDEVEQAIAGALAAWSEKRKESAVEAR